MVPTGKNCQPQILITMNSVSTGKLRIFETVPPQSQPSRTANRGQPSLVTRWSIDPILAAEKSQTWEFTALGKETSCLGLDLSVCFRCCLGSGGFCLGRVFLVWVIWAVPIWVNLMILYQPEIFRLCRQVLPAKACFFWAELVWHGVQFTWMFILAHRIHVWYIHLHLPVKINQI